MTSRWKCIGLLAVCLCFIGSELVAQKRDDRERGGPPRMMMRPEGGPRMMGPPGGDYSRRGRGRGGGSREERMVSFLKRLDTNQNGILEPSEVESSRLPFIKPMMERMKIDPKKPIPISKIQEIAKTSMSRSRGAEASGKSSSERGKSKTKQKKDFPPPKVAGFGIKKGDSPKVRTFGKLDTKTSSAKSSSRPSSSSSSSTTSSSPAQSSKAEDEKYRRYAEGLLKRYDKNGNGKLEKEEWSSMRGKMSASDTNHDGIITVDELIVHLRSFSRNPRSQRSSSSSGSSGSSYSSESGQKTYRFLSPTERLPEDLPSWFSLKDRNADGQVTMAEYSTSWTESLVSEFNAFDHNRDGVLTPKECLSSE